MNARELESAQLQRCKAAAFGQIMIASNQREANIFRLAAMVIHSRFPQAAQQLMQASTRYFAQYPDQQLTAQQVLCNRWLLSLPRLRDLLSQQLQAHSPL